MPRRSWPVSVARVILHDGYSESTGTQLKRSQPTTGPALVRRQAAKRPNTLTASLYFQTYAEYQAFLAWFEDVETGLAGGIYVVDMPHPLTGELLGVRFIPESEEAAFTATPLQRGAFAWVVNVRLEVMP